MCYRTTRAMKRFKDASLKSCCAVTDAATSFPTQRPFDAINKQRWPHGMYMGHNLFSNMY